MPTVTEASQILSSEECVQIVRKSQKLPEHEAITILKYSIIRGSNELVGFMGEYYKLQISISDKNDGETHLEYFLKSVPISNKFHRDECQRKGFFDKESIVYTDILPNIQKYIPSKLYPECYYTRRDLIVLEDLSISTEGFRHTDATKPYTINHHEVMLRHLAKLHAGSLAWEINEKVQIAEKFKDVLVEMQLTMKNEWYETGAKGIMYLAKIHPKYQTNQAEIIINEKLYEILNNVEQLTEPSTQFQNVICHRDSWDRNIFYNYNKDGEPQNCRIVDFQLTRYSPPAIDVLFFLYITTSKEHRDRIYNQCLDYYHVALIASLKELGLSENLITKEEFLQDCKRAKLAVLVLMAICEPLLKMPKGLANKLRADEPERFDYYMNHKREELFQRVMALDADYKEAILAPIAELMDYLLKNEEFENKLV